MRTRGTRVSQRGARSRPSTLTRSADETRWPSVAGASFTVTRPAPIHTSMSRREPRPERARTFWSFSVGVGGAAMRRSGGGGDGRSPGLLVDRVVGRGGRRGFAGRGQLEALADFFKGRQLLQRAQAEVVEEFPGGCVER